MSTETDHVPGTPLVFKLSTPLKTHKGELHELEMKPVTAKAFTLYGTPFRDYTVNVGGVRESRSEFVWASVLGFTHMATGIDIPTLEGIGAEDLFPLANKVVELITRRPND